MVHGGLRYLKQGQLGVMLQSVRERQNLLAAGEGLVTRLGFLMPMYKGDKNIMLYQAGLAVYDLMALRWDHRQYDSQQFTLLAPRINAEALAGGFYFEDAQTDDARLVLRVLQEAVGAGATIMNYAAVEDVLKINEVVSGVLVRDGVSGATHEVYGGIVINATGAWVDRLRAAVQPAKRIRPLRGSHLLLPAWRFPVAQAITFPHPHDQRPVFVYPWEGVTLVGTTDIDHQQDLNNEPHISGTEVAYLLAACNYQFPALNLNTADIIATFAGVRPVVGTGKSDPSKESRDHIVWLEDGLLSVTGGKLTTFRVIALDALKTALPYLPEGTILDEKADVLNPVALELPANADELPPTARARLLGRYGEQTVALLAAAQTTELQPIGTTTTLWAELRWAARAEGVVHLDDLLLRRTRIGLLLTAGGMSYMERIRAICQAELGWNDATWQAEVARYQTLWQTHYSLPATETIPDWHLLLPAPPPAPLKTRSLPLWSIGLLALIGILGVWWWLRRKK
jgi:glycerol-3-phosphate dehydrogenase